MPTNKEILELIRQLNTGLSATVSDTEKNDSVAFYKESIKNYALRIFESAQLLTSDEKPVTSKPHTEIKIIKQPTVESVPEIEKPLLKSDPPPVQTLAETVVKPKPVLEQSKPETHQQIENRPKNQDILTDEEDTSLNAKIAKFQQPVINVADKLKDNPIKELVKAISISKKFEFINELFNGNAEVYKTCLQTVEKSQSFDEASRYIETQIAETYQWNENEQLASEFFSLVKRRFL